MAFYNMHDGVPLHEERTPKLLFASSFRRGCCCQLVLHAFAEPMRVFLLRLHCDFVRRELILS